MRIAKLTRDLVVGEQRAFSYCVHIVSTMPGLVASGAGKALSVSETNGEFHATLTTTQFASKAPKSSKGDESDPSPSSTSQKKVTRAQPSVEVQPVTLVDPAAEVLVPSPPLLPLSLQAAAPAVSEQETGAPSGTGGDAGSNIGVADSGADVSSAAASSTAPSLLSNASQDSPSSSTLPSGTETWGTNPLQQTNASMNSKPAQSTTALHPQPDSSDGSSSSNRLSSPMDGAVAPPTASADANVEALRQALNPQEDLGANQVVLAPPVTPSGDSALETSSLGLPSKGAALPSGSVASPDGSVKDRSLSSDLKGKRKADADAAKDIGSNVSAAPNTADPSSQKISSHQPTSSAQSSDAATNSLATIDGPSAGNSTSLTRDPSTGAAAHAPVASAASGTPDVTPVMSSAQLIQSMNHSEMRLGMQSAEFGNISINTSLRHELLSAQISIDHPELGQILSNHLPAIQEKLGAAYGLQATVEIQDNSQRSNGGSGRQSEQGQPARQQGDGSVSTTPLSASTRSPVLEAADAARLDIRI